MRTKGPGESALLLLDVLGVLNLQKIEYAVVGAMAASVHGAVRASLDADAVLSLAAPRLRTLEREFAAVGFRTECRFGDSDDPIAAMLVLQDGHDNRVDLIAGLRGLEPEAFNRAIKVPFQGVTLRVVGREDFVAMKLFAGGPQDIADAICVARVVGGGLDLHLLRRLAQRYGRDTVVALDRLISEIAR
jgi:predicted nucleotidyltransferase